MPILAVEQHPIATDVHFDDTAIHILLADGREISAPLEWFPRLRDALPEQRRHWRLIGRGEGLHWPDLDEDISISGLLGHQS